MTTPVTAVRDHGLLETLLTIDSHLCRMLESVSGSVGILIGAITIAATETIVEALTLAEPWESIAVFPIVLGVLWAQVLLVTALRRLWY